MKALVGSEVQTMNLSQTISLVHKPHLFTEFKTKQMNTWKHRNKRHLLFAFYNCVIYFQTHPSVTYLHFVIIRHTQKYKQTDL